MGKLALVTSTKVMYETLKKVQTGAHTLRETPKYLTFMFGNEEHLKGFIDSFNPFLVDRDICETDINTLQLLPYVIFHIVENGVNKYFTYQRGAKGGESRLYANYSIGVGGHIEKDVDFENNKNTFNIIVDGVLCEAEEEVGIKLDRGTAINALNKAVFIHDTSDTVGQVHLGIVLVISLTNEVLESKEPGIIDNVSWNTRSQLNDLKLEGWSCIVNDVVLPLTHG